MQSTSEPQDASPTGDKLAGEIAAAREDLARREGIPLPEVRCVVSPYRICPLGAHSDHQGGTVLGMAISAYTVLAFAPNPCGEVRVHYNAHPPPRDSATEVFALDAPGEPRPGSWGRYVRGCGWVLGDLLPPRPTGMVASVRGTLPGAGLSSSASVDLAYLLALAEVNGLQLSPKQIALRAMRVENEYLGLGCGLLDPASIVGSRRGHLLRIDCRTVGWQPIPPARDMPPYRILVAFSGLTRQLTTTSFNDRVAECGRAAARIGSWVGKPGIRRLGELPLDVIEAHLERLPAAESRRARHFASEARRVRSGLEAWERGDLATFGALMEESCQSSIHQYECGSPEIVGLHEILRQESGVLGNRFSGGGYGGCCIALVEPTRAQAILESVSNQYGRRYPELRDGARFFLVEGEDGVRLA